MDRVRASHILVKTLEEATKIKGQIQNNDDFVKMAQQHSICPSRSNGGDLNVFGRGAMVKSFEDAAFGLEVGNISEPVQTEFGYHLILRTA